MRKAAAWFEAEDLGNMFQFQADFEKELLPLRDPVLSKSLTPELQSFDQWLAQTQAGFRSTKHSA